MKTGLSARLLLPQYPGREFEAKVIANANAITLNSRTLLVQLLAENRDGRCGRAPSGKSGSSCRPTAAPLSVPAGAFGFPQWASRTASRDAR